jgi:hypothetical protein
MPSGRHKKKFKIGDRVTVHNTGALRGLVVDYVSDTVYAVAFPPVKGKDCEYAFDEDSIKLVK